ncbi:MAG: hypothetical protein R2789_09500 [Microthrixaceae bacterium]
MGASARAPSISATGKSDLQHGRRDRGNDVLFGYDDAIGRYLKGTGRAIADAADAIAHHLRADDGDARQPRGTHFDQVITIDLDTSHPHINRPATGSRPTRGRPGRRSQRPAVQPLEPSAALVGSCQLLLRGHHPSSFDPASGRVVGTEGEDTAVNHQAPTGACHHRA